MELLVKRVARRDEYTIGRLYINGVKFSDTLEDCDRGLTQDMPLEEIKAKKVYGKTAIPTGTYEIDMNTISPKFQARSWAKPYGGKLPRLLNVPGYEGVLIHCLHPDMQILTDKGWQDMESITSDVPCKCWSLNTDTNKMELESIDEVIVRDYVGELYCCEYPQGKYNNTSYRVTDKHRMFCEWESSYKKNRGFVEAKDLPYGATFVTQSETSYNTPVDNRTLTMCKLCMHIVADGYVRWYKTAKGEDRCTISFHYKKERKINRVIHLLKLSGLEYSHRKNKDGSTVIRVLHPSVMEIAEMVDPNHLGKDGKMIPMSFTMLPKEQMIDLIEEYNFADGKHEGRKESHGYVISSTNTKTLDTLETMAFLCGMSCSMSQMRYSNTDKNWKDAFELYIQKRIVNRTPAQSSYYKQPYNGKVFCISNRNHTIVARNSQCDVPFILGNCGNTPSDTSGCILPGKNSIKGMITDSTRTFHTLMSKFLLPAKVQGERITITIE